ncbi:hypothetical protein V7798_32415 [Rhizobium laguerreae]
MSLQLGTHGQTLLISRKQVMPNIRFHMSQLQYPRHDSAAWKAATDLDFIHPLETSARRADQARSRTSQREI